MLKTNYFEFEHDLEESVTAFCPLDSHEIEVVATQNEKAVDNFLVDVTVDQKNFQFVYTLKDDVELIQKRFKKRFLKASIYKVLSDVCNTVLPWGALTGIRPTKLAYQCLNTIGEYKDYFKNEMLVSDVKLRLVEDILDAQSDYTAEIGSVSALYVSVPFCPSRCLYCSFVSNVISKEKFINEYIEGLCEEIRQSKPLAKNLRSVYIGGGTPVCLTDEQFEKILQAVGQVDCEYTIEAGRPDSIDKNKLELMKTYGVTRVCVNPQTFCDKTLSNLSRKHTAQDIIDKFALVKSFGFDVNMDLIAGLPGENFEIFKASVDKVKELSPENVTVHTLALKRGSLLKERVDRLTDGDIVEMVDYASKTFASAGYRPYYLYRQKYMAGNLENTGYSKIGKECVYNLDNMEEWGQIIGCGANAVSKRIFKKEDRIERYGAPKDISTYIAKISEILTKKKELFK